jgi:hypothetical protein
MFFGLWLLPLGYLVVKSGYFPKVIGVLLAIAGAGYLVDLFTSFSPPASTPTSRCSSRFPRRRPAS